METLEELQAILDNAPEGATHYDEDGDYVKFIEGEAYYYRFDCGLGWDNQYAYLSETRSLADVQHIVDLMKQLKLENEK